MVDRIRECGDPFHGRPFFLQDDAGSCRIAGPCHRIYIILSVIHLHSRFHIFLHVAERFDQIDVFDVEPNIVVFISPCDMKFCVIGITVKIILQLFFFRIVSQRAYIIFHVQKTQMLVYDL